MIAPTGFPAEYTGYITNEAGDIVETGRIMIDDLADYAVLKGAEKIVLQGNTDYCLGIKEEIDKKLATEYANKNIIVEVM
jgi:hypothetical protein